MYTGKIFKVKDMVFWTRYETFSFVGIITLWVAFYFIGDIQSFRIPWTPLGLIGTAVAFMIGFQNNAVYDRIWEARKIWGGIVNESRTFGAFVQNMVTNEYAKSPQSEKRLQEEIRILTYRHIAWITALRYAMRNLKSWETAVQHKTNSEWGMQPPEWKVKLEDELRNYLSDEDLENILNRGNHQTALLYQQSKHLRALKEEGLVWEFSFLELEGLIQQFFNLQGKTERIKNFPYPRQYATLNHYFMWLLLLLLPLGLVPQFADIGKEVGDFYPVLGKYFIWLTVPMYTAIAWMFHTMERIGRTGENPFEGTANDVPISTIARGIEIDLLQNLNVNKEDIPAPFPIDYDTQW
jgi:putative membrane protein